MNDTNELVKRHSLELIICAHTKSQIPEVEEAQIALAGRSNVGKSSLVNALAGRKKLAKISATPGKTRSINFYKVLPCDYYLVDLPGYGYARASHEEQKNWSNVLEYYLDSSKKLKALALLLDCRLPPQTIDLALVEYARARGIPILPVLTKADKCTQKEKKLKQEEWQTILGTRPLLVSSQKKQGLEKLWQTLDEAAIGKYCEE